MPKRKRQPQWHLYDFQCDDDGSCALTAILTHGRVHVIADIDNFDQKSKLGSEFRELVKKYTGVEDGQDVASPQQRVNGSGDKDSGIDMTADDNDCPDIHDKDANSDLLNWMLSPVFACIENKAHSKSVSTGKNLEEWYHASTEFYDLSITGENNDTLSATEVEATKELQKVVDNLLPSVTLPKSLTEKLKVTYFSAKDLKVLQCSDQPPGTPYHPCRVRHQESKRNYFFKVVDNGQRPTTKRELDVLGSITKLRLHEHMRVPALEGVVFFEDAKSTASGKRKIMGFLQTEIPDPTPLTNLLDPSIPQSKRERWAVEAENLKAELHKNNIIWGDAKADNFMVDKDDNLWIIDFGGSYTEGWVDPELKETKEGDDQGTNKTINALKDPEACTQDSDEEGLHEKSEKAQSNTKRKRDVGSDGASDGSPGNASKRRRSSRLRQST